MGDEAFRDFLERNNSPQFIPQLIVVMALKEKADYLVKMFEVLSKINEKTVGDTAKFRVTLNSLMDQAVHVLNQFDYAVMELDSDPDSDSDIDPDPGSDETLGN